MDGTWAATWAFRRVIDAKGLLSLLKDVAHAGGSHTDKELNELGSRGPDVHLHG